jgi:hypothetical protein
MRRHLQFAWWSLLCFLSLGAGLEALHGFKVGWYLESASETRRLVWTLGHAHGALLALVNAVFGISLKLAVKRMSGSLRAASPMLMAAGILLPGGFFLGGIYIYEGDPGVGIFLVPIGAAFLFLSVLLTAIGLSAGGVADEK